MPIDKTRMEELVPKSHLEHPITNSDYLDESMTLRIQNTDYGMHDNSFSIKLEDEEGNTIISSTYPGELAVLSTSNPNITAVVTSKSALYIFSTKELAVLATVSVPDAVMLSATPEMLSILDLQNCITMFKQTNGRWQFFFKLSVENLLKERNAESFGIASDSSEQRWFIENIQVVQ